MGQVPRQVDIAGAGAHSNGMKAGFTHTVKMGLLLGGVLLCAAAQAEIISDIRNTKHNFSATVVPTLPDGAARNVQATNESQICAFCHTPHKTAQQPKAPIWNRKLSGVTYTPYASTSMEAVDLGQPNTKSKLCLSCHDGTLAIGSVNVLNREENPTISVAGTRADGSMPDGLGSRSGFTRRIGTDLTNDHPISFTYDTAQFVRDGELRDPAVESFLGIRSQGGHKPTIPLDDGQMECVSCHDPHVRSTNEENIKFLRVNRFQQAQPVEGSFDQANDVICLACHEKSGWADSAHANVAVANEVYTDAAADLREFPRNIQVWQAACFNCHDPHTVQGSRRLLREGTDDEGQLTTTGLRIKQGGRAAIEETCYACHSADGGVLQGQSVRPGFEVPDVKTDFTTMRIRMPIASSDQPAQEERHSIGTATGFAQDGKDFMESPQRMGKGDLSNRHAECTDCHNPHRVIKNRRFNDDPKIPDSEGTHNHTLTQVSGTPEGIHTNVASGVLRGTWGIEPTAWTSTAFMSEPTVFNIKRGDGYPGAPVPADPDAASYVTREYQICMKCHSNYSYDTPPPLGINHSGGTQPGTNSLFNYTNQGMEYQSPDTHKGEGTPADNSPTGALSGSIGECGQINYGTRSTPEFSRPGYLDSYGNCVNYVEDNHRAWHPVLKDTGRTALPGGGGVRSASSNAWLEPFNAAVGIQTMYCTDCHGSDTAAGTVVPVGGEQGNVWGPHGSNSDFLLKGPWNKETGQNTPEGLCFKCHDYNSYGKKFPRGPGGASQVEKSGFSTQTGGATCLADFAGQNLHSGHAMDGQVVNFRCNYCHIAIPHGWKNKNFLVNLNDVGPEIGLPAGGKQVRNKTNARYFRGPYYNGSVLKVVSFRQSGQWLHSACGSAGTPGNDWVGGNNNDGNIPWMTFQGAGSEACNLLP